jgi:phytoene dehydrogenase-like protein
MSAHEADVVVAGAGHNSLIAAAYLAKAGFEVVVLEARDRIGGNTATEELTLPGFKHDSCSSAHVLIQSNPLMRNNELQLDRYGLRYVYTDPVVVMPCDDGSAITMWRDRKKTAEELARFSPSDGRAYLSLLEEWDGRLSKVHGRVNNFPPAELVKDSPGARSYAELARRSALEVIDERFSHPKVRSLMTWLSFATIQPLDKPGTGILPFAVTAGRAEFGWASPLGGSDSLPRALAALIREHGGRVVTSAAVTEVIVKNGRAAGAITAAGERYTARRAVLSTIHVAQLEEVLPPHTLPDEFVNSVRTWRPGLTLFAAHLALARTPGFLVEGRVVESVAGALGSAQGLLDQLEAFGRGQTSTRDPWTLVVCSTALDRERAPDGKGILKLLTIAPYDLVGGRQAWAAEKERFADFLTRRTSDHMDLDDSDILARVAECPLDLEARNRHNHRGSCHGGALDPDQSGVNRPVPGWSEYRLPVEGLYQTGATTHPGGSVSGRPGRNAARVMLSDLGVDVGRFMTS